MSFTDIYQELRDIILQYQDKLIIVNDSEGDIYLDTQHVMKNKKPLFFGAVKIGRSYVSYHLMPVYIFPELLDDISPELKNRMQGKSCFNFAQANQDLFRELDALTRRGYEQYISAGYL